MDTVISSLAELQALRERRNRRVIERVALNLPADPALVARAERDMNRGLRACGCEVGAVFLIAGVLAMAAAMRWWPGHIDVATPRGWATIAVVLGCFAFAGKIAGLVLAELRLRSAIRAVVRQLRDERSPAAASVR